MPSHEYVGELLLSLNYYPTTQRLTIVILKARNLKIETTSGLWGKFSVYLYNSKAIYCPFQRRIEVRVVFVIKAVLSDQS